MSQEKKLGSLTEGGERDQTISPADASALTPNLDEMRLHLNLEKLPAKRTQHEEDFFSKYNANDNALFQDHSSLKQIDSSPIKIADNPIEQIKNAVGHQYRGHELQEIHKIPAKEWTTAFREFPEFEKIGHVNERQLTRLIKGIIANELYFYNGSDFIEDKAAGTGAPSWRRWTLGAAQQSALLEKALDRKR